MGAGVGGDSFAQGQKAVCAADLGEDLGEACALFGEGDRHVGLMGGEFRQAGIRGVEEIDAVEFKVEQGVPSDHQGGECFEQHAGVEHRKGADEGQANSRNH